MVKGNKSSGHDDLRAEPALVPTQNSYDSIRSQPTFTKFLLQPTTSPVLTYHGWNSMGPGQGRGSGALAGRALFELDLAQAPGPARTSR